MCHVYLRAKNTRFFLQLALKGFLVLFLVKKQARKSLAAVPLKKALTF